MTVSGVKQLPYSIDTEIATFAQPRDICNLRLSHPKYAGNPLIKELTKYEAIRQISQSRLPHFEGMNDYFGGRFPLIESVFLGVGACFRTIVPSVSDYIAHSVSQRARSRLLQHTAEVDRLQGNAGTLLSSIPPYLSTQYNIELIEELI